MDESSNRGASIDSSNWDDEYFDAPEPPDSGDEWFDALQPHEPDAESDKEWDKPKYKNWVRGAKGLEYLQEGLHTFVGDRVLRQRDQVLQKITSVFSPGSPIQCNQCTPENMLPEHTKLNCNKNPCIQKSRNCFGSKPKGKRKCPIGICSHIYDEIVYAHLFKDPLWKHSDPSTWCSDPLGWSFAKCFQTTPNPGRSPAETDAAGLLSIILSDAYFQTEVACNLTWNGNMFYEARNARNSILHSPLMELEESELQHFVDTFIQVLQDAKHLLNDQRANQSVKNLKQLKNDQITISLSEHIKLIQVRKEALQALEQLQEREREAIAKIDEKWEEGLAAIEGATAVALEKINESDVHTWKLQTEARIQQLVDTVQTMKERTALVTPVDFLERSNDDDTSSDRRMPSQSDLRDNLISFYRDQHGTISVSPLIEEETPVLEFYVMPEIYSVNVQRTEAGVKEVKTPVTPFGNVFYKVNKSCRKIYLTADAGLGKTAFSKRLALTWCHAKEPHTEEGQFFSQEEVQAMHEFRFVFLLFLRDSSNECDIVDLIWTQVVSQLPPLYTRKHLENILFKERCLVILDGLDEWCHPSNSCKHKTSSIPHRKAREQTVVLTTTRPWKLSVSGLHSSQIDQKLEIMGLNQNSANALKKSVISHLCADKNEYEVKQDVEEFTRTLQEKQISDLETIPLLLTYLLFLWCNRIELGQSQCDLYSQIIELLLSRTVQNYRELSPKVDPHQGDIPQCLSQQTHCTQFYSLLKELGQLAYQTLFMETKAENTLVFDSSVAELCLNKDCLTFCLKTGILTQSKVPGTLLKQKSKVSFAHKTVQEYFAALYIRSTPDQTSVPETVLSKFTCVKDILEMSKILIFLSGFNVNVSTISRELMKIINEDEITREYRNSLGESEPLKQFQDMCISCCKELPHETEVSFCLQDVFIDDSCQQEQYRENLKQLTSRNKQNNRSLYIDIDDAPYSSAQEVIEYFALSDLENIEKIHYQGEYKDRDILPLLERSVQSLSLSCSESSWSDLLSEKVTSLQNLEAIYIGEFKMSHEQLTLLYDYISHRHCMREIELLYLKCSDHGRDSCTDSEDSFTDSEDSCTGCSLELSKNSQLRVIRLDSIPVSELNINMSSLEKCELRGLSNPDLVLRFINCVPADSKVNKFVCYDLTSSAAIETIQQTLPLLVHVEGVLLWHINLGNINLCSSEMVNIECVYLWEVTVPASVLRAIVPVLQQLTQTVTIDMKYCNITPESDFFTVKEEIKQSSQFRVMRDSEDSRGKNFEFKTIKDGD